MGETTKEYLHRVLAETGWSPTYLARQAKVASTTLTRPMQPEHPHGLSFRTVRNIEAASGIPFEGSVGAAGRLEVDESAFAAIPRYAVELSGGAGSSILDNAPLDHIPFTHEFLRRRLGRQSPAGLAMLEARGDSMEPLISDGDLVMVDTERRGLSGAVTAFRLGGEAFIKRVQSVGAKIQVISENSAYPPFTVDMNHLDDFAVIGQVRWIGRVL